MNEMVGKMKDTAGTIGRTAVEMLSEAAYIAALSARIAGIKTEKEVMLRDLGKLVYGAHLKGESDSELLGDKLAAIDKLTAKQKCLAKKLSESKKRFTSACPVCDKINDAMNDGCCQSCND